MLIYGISLGYFILHFRCVVSKTRVVWVAYLSENMISSRFRPVVQTLTQTSEGLCYYNGPYDCSLENKLKPPILLAAPLNTVREILTLISKGMWQSDVREISTVPIVTGSTASSQNPAVPVTQDLYWLLRLCTYF